MQKLVIALGLLALLAAGFFLFRFTEDGAGGLGAGSNSEISAEDEARSGEGFAARRRAADPLLEGGKALPEIDAEPSDESAAAGRGAILGRFVRRGDGTPVAGIEASFEPMDGGTARRAKSDDEGRIRIAFPSARPAGRLIARSETLALEPRLVPAAPEDDLLDLGRLELDPAVIVTGQVQDPQGKGIKDARVAAYPHRKMEMLNFDLVQLFNQVVSEDEALLVVATDEEGRFRIEGLPERLWILQASAEARETKFSRALDLHAGAPCDVTLKLGSAARLAGLVKDEHGQPLEGVRVMAVANADGPDGAMRSHKATSDAQGAFRFEHLSPGSFQVMARQAGRVCRESQSIELPAETVEIVMDPAGRLLGRIFDQATNAGIPEAEVIGLQWQSSAFAMTRTDEKGDFILPDMPRKGEFFVMVRIAGYSMAVTPGEDGSPFGLPGLVIKDGDLASGEARREIAMVGGTSVEGRVYDQASGKGIAGARVRCLGVNSFYGGAGAGNVETVTDAEGKYKLVGAPIGRFKMLASAPGYFTPRGADDEDPWAIFEMEEGKGPAVVAGQALLGIDVAMRQGVKLEGRVVDAKEKAVNGATVYWLPTSESPMAGFAALEADGHMARSRADGGFEFIGLAPGMKIEIRAQHRAFAASERLELEVGQEGTKDVVVKMKPGGIVRGRLLMPDGSGAAGRMLQAQVDRGDRYLPMGGIIGSGADGEEDTNVTTDLDGGFEFRNLPAGQIEVGLFSEDEFVLNDASRQLLVVADEVRQQNLQLERTATISGRVVDAEGKPLASVWVMAQIEDPNEGQPSPGEEVPWTFQGQSNGAQSDEKGEFTITGLKEGRKFSVSADQWGEFKNEEGETDYRPTGHASVEGVSTGTKTLLLTMGPVKD